MSWHIFSLKDLYKKEQNGKDIPAVRKTVLFVLFDNLVDKETLTSDH